MNRSLNNCNPLNIRRVAGVRWQGQRPAQSDPHFVQFQTIEWGLRAACCILHTYAHRHGIDTPAAIIRRWAPPAENDTDAYLRNVCRWTGLQPQQRLTEAQWPLLLRAMARQESGLQLPDDLLARGLALYLVNK